MHNFTRPWSLSVHRRHAFSLVELSIVLVILGLLVGGVLSGQSLIRASELRAITKEYSTYFTAVRTFQGKYFAIPGDMATATQFWGEQDAVPATCQTTASTTALTCNGNGDGYIGINSLTYYEMFRFWQQLADAGLIIGNYTGIPGPHVNGVEHIFTGTSANSPASRLGKAGWGVSTNNSVSGGGSTDYGVVVRGNYFRFGGTYQNVPYLKVATPTEAWNLDTKIDDGRPGRGKVIARWWDDCTLATANTDLDAGYDLMNTKIDCSFEFPNAF